MTDLLKNKQIYVQNLKNYIGHVVTIKGWVYNKRSKGKVRFLLVRDGTGIVQCVSVINELPHEKFDICESIPYESSIMIQGEVREDKRAPGGVELSIKDLQVVHIAKDYPITLKSHGVDFLMDHRHLWLRSRRQNAILKIRATVVKSIRDFFDNNGFILFDAPIITPAACEGTTTLFNVDYFDEIAYLSQSGQLYQEAGAMAFGKVYCFGPTFRAEKSKTRKHLTEFWMVEPEVAYADLDDIMKLAEDFVSYIVQRALEDRKEELKILERDTSILEKVNSPFPKISYTDAMEIIKSKGLDFEWGNDFGAPHEFAISESFEKPVMVHRYPMQCKAFYMKTDPEDEKLALCVDVLAPEGGGEIIGGGQREDDFDRLYKHIKKHNLPEEAFRWYLDLRRYGSVPHAGFGLGLERMVAWITGASHVRETIPFPRMLYRLYP